MSRKGFSVVIVPDDTGKVIEKRITSWKVKALAVGVSVFIICSFVFAVGYFNAKIDQSKLASLTEENYRLSNEIKNLQPRVRVDTGRCNLPSPLVR